MSDKKELNPSPKFPDGEYPQLSPNPNTHDGLVDNTDEKANTQVSPTLNPEDKPIVFDKTVYFEGTTYYKGKDIGTAFGEKGLVFTNVTVNNWVSDATYADYPYKAEITCNGITAQSVVEVIFALAQAISGNYAPVCLSGTDKVTIYGKANTSITIPTIKEVL